MGLRTSMSVDEIARGAECVASLTGCAIMLSSQILSFPDVVLAVGFAMAFLGGVFSARSSTQAIPIEKRLPYTIIGFIITTAMIAMVCYIVWDYTVFANRCHDRMVGNIQGDTTDTQILLRHHPNDRKNGRRDMICLRYQAVITHRTNSGTGTLVHAATESKAYPSCPVTADAIRLNTLWAMRCH